MTDSLIRVRLGGQGYDLPSTGINGESATAGYGRPIHEIRLNEVEYEPLNEQGKQLLMEISPFESLGSVNLACAFMSVTGNTEAVRQVVDSARGWSPKPLMESMDFYCPLTVRVEDGDDLEEGDPFMLVEHEDLSSDALKEAVPPGDNVARYMHRCSQPLQDKVASAVWDIGKIYGQVYGVIRCELYAPLTADEKNELSDWIRGQNFDGFGESFEQTPIDTPEGDIYVSFGSSGPGCFVYDFEQFTAYMNGGLPTMAPEPENRITFYCPLMVSCFDDGEEELVSIGNEYLVWHEDEIRAALRAEIREGENMANYLTSPLQDKIASVEWDVAVIGGTAYGKITCELTESLDMDEQAELAGWISGQNSDGLGEGFEQRPVKTSDSELFVHLWEWDDGYFVLPEDEFRAQVLEQSQDGQGFGGMGV